MGRGALFLDRDNLLPTTLPMDQPAAGDGVARAAPPVEASPFLSPAPPPPPVPEARLFDSKTAAQQNGVSAQHRPSGQISPSQAKNVTTPKAVEGLTGEGAGAAGLLPPAVPVLSRPGIPRDVSSAVAATRAVDCVQVSLTLADGQRREDAGKEKTRPPGRASSPAVDGHDTEVLAHSRALRNPTSVASISTPVAMEYNTESPPRVSAYQPEGFLVADAHDEDSTGSASSTPATETGSSGEGLADGTAGESALLSAVGAKSVLAKDGLEVSQHEGALGTLENTAEADVGKTRETAVSSSSGPEAVSTRTRAVCSQTELSSEKEPAGTMKANATARVTADTMQAEGTASSNSENIAPSGRTSNGISNGDYRTLPTSDDDGGCAADAMDVDDPPPQPPYDPAGDEAVSQERWREGRIDRCDGITADGEDEMSGAPVFGEAVPTSSVGTEQGWRAEGEERSKEVHTVTRSPHRCRSTQESSDDVGSVDSERQAQGVAPTGQDVDAPTPNTLLIARPNHVMKLATVVDPAMKGVPAAASAAADNVAFNATTRLQPTIAKPKCTSVSSSVTQKARDFTSTNPSLTRRTSPAERPADDAGDFLASGRDGGNQLETGEPEQLEQPDADEDADVGATGTLVGTSTSDSLAERTGEEESRVPKNVGFNGKREAAVIGVASPEGQTDAGNSNNSGTFTAVSLAIHEHETPATKGREVLPTAANPVGETAPCFFQRTGPLNKNTAHTSGPGLPREPHGEGPKRAQLSSFGERVDDVGLASSGGNGEESELYAARRESPSSHVRTAQARKGTESDVIAATSLRSGTAIVSDASSPAAAPQSLVLSEKRGGGMSVPLPSAVTVEPDVEYSRAEVAPTAVLAAGPRSRQGLSALLSATSGASPMPVDAATEPSQRTAGLAAIAAAAAAVASVTGPSARITRPRNNAAELVVAPNGPTPTSLVGLVQSKPADAPIPGIKTNDAVSSVDKRGAIEADSGVEETVEASAALIQNNEPTVGGRGCSNMGVDEHRISNQTPSSTPVLSYDQPSSLTGATSVLKDGDHRVLSPRASNDHLPEVATEVVSPLMVRAQPLNLTEHQNRLEQIRPGGVLREGFDPHLVFPLRPVPYSYREDERDLESAGDEGDGNSSFAFTPSSPRRSVASTTRYTESSTVRLLGRGDDLLVPLRVLVDFLSYLDRACAFIFGTFFAPLSMR